MTKRAQFAKNTLVIALSKICTQFMSLLLLPLYTHFMSTEEYGVFDIATTYVLLLTPVIALRMDIAAFRWLIDARGNKARTHKIIANIIQILLLSIVVFTALFIATTLWVDIPFAPLFFAYIISSMLSNSFLQIIRGIGKLTIYAIASMAAGLFSALLSFVLLSCLDMGLSGALIGTISGNMIGITISICAVGAHKVAYRKLTSMTLKKELLLFSIPMIPNSISWWIVDVSDRTIISIVLGASLNGIYAVSNKLVSPLSGVFSILESAWLESVSAYRGEKDYDLFLSSTISTLIRLLGSASLIILSVVPFAFELLVSNGYSDAKNYIPVLLLGLFLDMFAKLFGAIYLANKQTKKIMRTTIASAVINLAVNLALIHFIGLWAAAISTAIAYAVMAIYRHYDIKKYVKITYEKGIFVKIAAVLTIAAILYYQNNIYCNIANFIIALAASIYLNRDLLRSGLKFVKGFSRK